jgi:uncharacterized protein (DUF305 family)
MTAPSAPRHTRGRFAPPARAGTLVLGGAALLAAACARSAPTPEPPAPDAAVSTSGADPHAGHTMPATAPAAAPAAAPVAHHHGHDMGPVTIPDGAIYTVADVQFMQGMIAHHAQAVHMTRMAESAGAGPRVLKLAQKIDLSQAGEIALMQEWLRANGQVAPDTSSWRTMSMPGMLTMAELDTLAASRGVAFDRRFLTLMIRHHEGALQMVADLMAAPRAAQDVDISVLANDVETTQTAEIGLMLQMLAELPTGEGAP